MSQRKSGKKHFLSWFFHSRDLKAKSGINGLNLLMYVSSCSFNNHFHNKRVVSTYSQDNKLALTRIFIYWRPLLFITEIFESCSWFCFNTGKLHFVKAWDVIQKSYYVWEMDHASVCKISMFFSNKIWIDIATDFLPTMGHPASFGTAVVSDSESKSFVRDSSLNFGLFQWQVRETESNIQFILLLFLRTSCMSWAFENLLESFS